MKIKLKQSQHKTLFSIFKPLLLKVVRPALTKALEQQIKQTFSDLDSLAYRVYQEESKIEEEIKRNPDPENVQNIYNRYYTAFQREVTQKTQKAKEIQANTKVNTAITKEDSMFKSISLPGGISTRATELKQQAAAGDRWENDIFTIGSASPSTSLPHPTPITRKSPHAQRRSIRERDTVSTGGQSRDSGYVPDAPSSDYPYSQGSPTSGSSGAYQLNRGGANEAGYDRYNTQTQIPVGYSTVT